MKSSHYNTYDQDLPHSQCCLFCSSDNRDVSLMMREMDVNAIAGTLKLYFRELPEPLFTDELYPNFAGGIGWYPISIEEFRTNMFIK